MTTHRKRRGRASELIIAQYLQARVPGAYAVGSGTPGADILGTPGLAIEVKARAQLDIPAWIRQATRNAKPGEMPAVVFRLNGQGPTAVAQWPAIITLENLINLQYGTAPDA